MKYFRYPTGYYNAIWLSKKKDQVHVHAIFYIHLKPRLWGSCYAIFNLVCVCCVDRCLSFRTFSAGHCVVCSSICGFWLLLWYLQTLLYLSSYKFTFRKKIFYKLAYIARLFFHPGHICGQNTRQSMETHH